MLKIIYQVIPSDAYNSPNSKRVDKLHYNLLLDGGDSFLSACLNRDPSARFALGPFANPVTGPLALLL